MIKGKFFLDPNGYPRAEYESPKELLGWYLEQDVQNSPATCDEILGICVEVLAGEKGSWSGVGNAHSVTIDSRNVTIENVFSNSSEPCEISLEDFKSALSKWRELIATVVN